MKRAWDIIGGGARFAGYIVFVLIVLSAPVVWVARALTGKIFWLARPRQSPVPERSPDDEKTDWAPSRMSADTCRTGHCCGVGCYCPITEPQRRREEGGVLMAHTVPAGLSSEERITAGDVRLEYHDHDYFDMENGPGGPMGPSEQAILWIIKALIVVALAALALLVGAGWAIWYFWPASWRLW